LMDLNLTDSSLKKKYIYADRQILAQHDIDDAQPAQDDRYFYLHDRLGSVRLVIDDQSAVKNTYTYEPFGEMFATECTETIENPFKFTGQYFDSEIEEYYLRARQYNPRLARFTSRDPLLGEPYEPLTLHTYLYALNDPIDMTDPTGEFLSAGALTAPVVAGYATHAFAIAVVAYAITALSDAPAMVGDAIMDIGFALERGIGDVMAYVVTGIGIKEAQAYAVKKQFPKDYPTKDMHNLERILDEHLRGMDGDPLFRNQDPKNFWEKVALGLLELWHNIKGK